MADARNESASTIGQAGIYALGNVLRYLTSFVMLPIYTTHLSPEDYGVLELLSMVIDLAGIILGMRLGEAIFRFYSRAPSRAEKSSVITTSFALVLVVNGIGVGLLTALAAPISLLVFGGVEYTQHIRLFALILLLQSLYEVPLLFVRAQERAWLYVGFSMFKLLLQVSLNIYFVVFLEMKVEGVIYGTLITGAIYTPLLFMYMLRHTGFAVDRRLLSGLVTFSVPLVIADIGSFYLTFGDRYFLRVFSSLSEIGIYALAYKFGFLLMYFTWVPFQAVWDIHKYAAHRDGKARDVYQHNFVFITAVMVSCALVLSVFIGDVLRVMSSAEFWPAAGIVPIVLLAYILQGWTFYSSFGVLLHGDTVQITYGSLLAVIVISVAYFGLIPSYGAYGAAWATVIAFLARLWWVHERARQRFDMDLPWAKAGSMLLLAATAYLATTMVPPHTLLGTTAKLAIVGLFITALFWLPFLTSNQKQAFAQLARNPRRFAQILR